MVVGDSSLKGFMPSLPSVPGSTFQVETRSAQPGTWSVEPPLLSEPAHRQRDILSSEAEAIAQHVVHALFASRVRDVIEVALGIGSLVVDRRREYALAKGHHADDEFD